MNRPTNPLIAQLASELVPVRPVKLVRGAAWLGAALALTIVGVAFVQGLWTGALRGEAAAQYFMANGLIVLAGAASAGTVLRMTSPRVGARQDSARWLLATLALLPLTALLLAAQAGAIGADAHLRDGLHCFLAGTGSGLGLAAVLVLWLRQGAPVAPNAAGFYTGIAAGALGSFAYGLSCPLDSIGHLGIWHVAPVAASAALGRIAIPPLIRW